MSLRSVVDTSHLRLLRPSLGSPLRTMCSVFTCVEPGILSKWHRMIRAVSHHLLGILASHWDAHHHVVTHIQANLVLALAELLSSSGSRHWLFTGTAIRMAEIMRLNKEFHQKHSYREQEIRRRTFWACLMFDRALAYFLGKHRTVNEESVSISVPGTDLSMLYQEETRGVTLASLAAYARPSDLGLTSYFIKTIILWSDLADFAAYSRRRLEKHPPPAQRASSSLDPRLRENGATLYPKASAGAFGITIPIAHLARRSFSFRCSSYCMALYPSLTNVICPILLCTRIWSILLTQLVGLISIGMNPWFRSVYPTPL